MFKKVLSKLNLGKVLVGSKTGENIVKGLENRYKYKIDRKKLGLYIDLIILGIVGLGLLIGKVSFEQFFQVISSL